jgi:hypothetical protein
MTIQKLDKADFKLVELKSTNKCNPTPHCKKHGAMNKVTKYSDGGGIWRCIASTGFQIVKNGNSISRKELEGICRAGCDQVISENIPA